MKINKQSCMCVCVCICICIFQVVFLLHYRLMITAVLADCKPVDLHIFRNYPSPSEMVDPEAPPGLYTPPPPPQEQLLWKAARASGAAPSYFRYVLLFC